MYMGGASPYNWSWDFGDGNISYQQYPQHTYMQSGTYIVTLTVKDFIGNICTVSSNATIREPVLIVHVDGVMIILPLFRMVSME